MGHNGHNVSCQTEPMAEDSPPPIPVEPANVLFTGNPIHRTQARHTRQSPTCTTRPPLHVPSPLPSGPPRALVIEDKHEATGALSARGYLVDRIPQPRSCFPIRRTLLWPSITRCYGLCPLRHTRVPFSNEKAPRIVAFEIGQHTPTPCK